MEFSYLSNILSIHKLDISLKILNLNLTLLDLWFYNMKSLYI